MTGLPLLVGQLLGIAFASGLNLYGTIAILGLASRLGWIDWLPPGLRGLEHGLLIASAGILFLIEFVIDKVPHLDSLWDAIHTFIRPTATALLALGALGGLPLSVQIAGTMIAGSVALAAHGTKAGLRLAINARSGRVARFVNIAISIAEDIAVVALVVAALRFPAVALVIAAVSLTTTIFVGPILWRASLLGIRALAARVRGFFEPARWNDLQTLPRALRALVAEPAIGRAEPRVARAALKGLRRVGAYRYGWLVITADGPVFLYRSLLGPRSVELTPIRTIRARRGPWTETLEIELDRARCTLFILGDTPPAELDLSFFVPLTP